MNGCLGEIFVWAMECFNIFGIDMFLFEVDFICRSITVIDLQTKSNSNKNLTI